MSPIFKLLFIVIILKININCSNINNSKNRFKQLIYSPRYLEKKDILNLGIKVYYSDKEVDGFLPKLAQKLIGFFKKLDDNRNQQFFQQDKLAKNIQIYIKENCDIQINDIIIKLVLGYVGEQKYNKKILYIVDFVLGECFKAKLDFFILSHIVIYFFCKYDLEKQKVQNKIKQKILDQLVFEINFFPNRFKNIYFEKNNKYCIENIYYQHLVWTFDDMYSSNFYDVNQQCLNSHEYIIKNLNEFKIYIQNKELLFLNQILNVDNDEFFIKMKQNKFFFFIYFFIYMIISFIDRRKFYLIFTLFTSSFLIIICNRNVIY